MSASGGEGCPFYKLSGAGNDFLALVEPNAPPDKREIRAWCRRGLSLGADGLFSLERRSGTIQMVHYNADGGRSDLCLNGSRCAVALACHLGWADGELLLETDAGVLKARATGAHRVALELPDFVGKPEALTLTLDGKAYQGWLLTVGVPHFVLPWSSSLGSAPVDSLGKALRSHPELGVAGANVDFVRYLSATHCELRTFERGVEAETFACGTGVVATVAAGVEAGELRAPITALTAGGYELIVRGGSCRRGASGMDEPWVLEGDARILARGELFLGASAVPSIPRWS